MTARHRIPLLTDHHSHPSAYAAMNACLDLRGVFDKGQALELIRQLHPDVLVKGSDWTGQVVGQQFVESIGGTVEMIPLSPGLSTTNIIDTVIQRHTAGGQGQGEDPLTK